MCDPIHPELKSLNHRTLHDAVPSQETIQGSASACAEGRMRNAEDSQENYFRRRRMLAELKGLEQTIPDQAMLIKTVVVQEA